MYHSYNHIPSVIVKNLTIHKVIPLMEVKKHKSKRKTSKMK